MLRTKLLAALGAVALLANAPGLPLHATVRYAAAAQPPVLSGAALSAEISQLRSKVKYVFVLYQENRSFDSYFGTFPGANGIYSQPASQTPGYTQSITNTDGTATTIKPFRIGPAQYAADTDDIDHSHPRIVAKMDIAQGTAKMDQFAQVEEAKYLASHTPALTAKQMGELAMAYEDCDTVPLLWNYANKFTLFDDIFQDMTGPSTPGNLTIIAAQSGTNAICLAPDRGVLGHRERRLRRARAQRRGSVLGLAARHEPQSVAGEPHRLLWDAQEGILHADQSDIRLAAAHLGRLRAAQAGADRPQPLDRSGRRAP